jgi:energy-coupling factor transporter transmembrane protein EcfT
MKKFIKIHIDRLIPIFLLLSLTSVTTYWWLSILSIVFFIWNFFSEKKKLRITNSFLFLTILLIIFNLTVIKPTEAWGDKVKAEWNKTGYDSTYLANAQEAINVIARSIEEYKHKYDIYPNDLSDIKDIFINNEDMSYRIKEANGQTNGVPFYYEKINSNKFYLAGVGKDGVIKTNDDLLPQISLEQKKRTGLVKYVVKSFSQKEIIRERNVIEMHKKTQKVQMLFNK